MLESVEIIDWILLTFLTVSAVSVVFVDNLLVNMVVMCAFSISIAALYLVMNAPDVAITEAAVGAGFSTVLMLVVLLHLGYKTKIGKWSDYGKLGLMGAGVLAGALFLILSYGVMDLPEFGDRASPANAAATVSYVSNAYSYTGIPNLVTAILASFRGYDTMCETVVVFAASVSVSLLIGKGSGK
ncbi:MAG: DUF4040 domain-containing protein [Aaplasma endosymbiont of Hyalomma asiaticum]